jgi:hypothetical protein
MTANVAYATYIRDRRSRQSRHGALLNPMPRSVALSANVPIGWEMTHRLARSTRNRGRIRLLVVYTAAKVQLLRQLSIILADLVADHCAGWISVQLCHKLLVELISTLTF